MSLTKDDLAAIENIVQRIVGSAVGSAIDDSDLRTAAGFAEVHEKMDRMNTNLSNRIDEVNTNLSAKIEALDNKIDVKDGKLENTVQRVDNLELEVKKLQLKAA